MRNSAPPGRRIMRLCSASSFFAFLCSAFVLNAQTPAPTCADLHLVPAVRECSAVESIRVGQSGVDMGYDKTAEDEFVGRDLKESIVARGVAVPVNDAPSIFLMRAQKVE